MDPMAIFNFFKDHGGEILDLVQNVFAAIGALYLSLLALVKITPTKKDDEFLEGIAKFFAPIAELIHRFAGAFGVKK